MVQKSLRSPATAVKPKRPGQDLKTARQASQFPTVGMTLHSYKYDPRDTGRQAKWRGTAVKKSRWQRFKQSLTLKRAVVTLAIIVLVCVGWVGGKFLYNAHKLFGGSIFSILGTTKLKGESDGRVNILLAGNSADDAGHNGGQLTDSIMLISIDTKDKKAFMLSIPRDLWVEIPDDGHKKINEAYVYGKDENFKESGYPDGGMGMLEKIVSDNLDLPIHYYALIDYSALKQSVNAVGGVDITIKSDDPRGIYDPNLDYTAHPPKPLVKLSNGTHHLNGQQALNLSRARGDSYNSYGFAGSDFTRTEHQRQILVALKKKAVSAGVLSNPARLSSLSDAIGNNVKTDFKLSEVHRLRDLIKDIGDNNIRSVSLNNVNGDNLLSSYTSPAGQSALIPAAGLDDFSDIQAFIRQLTSSNPLAQENARVVVLNGTSVNGLAGKTKSLLQHNRLQVTQVGDAGNLAQVTTTVIDTTSGSKPATRQALAKLFGNHITSQNPYGSKYDTDFIVVLGTDQASRTTSGAP